MTIQAQENEYNATRFNEWEDSHQPKRCKLCNKELDIFEDDYYEICSECRENIHKHFEIFVEAIMEGEYSDYEDCKEFLLEYVNDKES